MNKKKYKRIKEYIKFHIKYKYWFLISKYLDVIFHFRRSLMFELYFFLQYQLQIHF